MRIAIYNPLTGQHDCFTNEGLTVGDEVWPLTHGWIDPAGAYHVVGVQKWAYLGFDPEAAIQEGHTIQDLQHSPDSKAYEVRTDKGCGPIESYFKKISP